MTMLGAQCSVCCGQCGCKPDERLPYTMTVEFSGLKNKTHGNYCDLIITSDVGGGAAGVATSPGGCNGDDDPLCCEYRQRSDGQCAANPHCDKSDRGPLAGVLLTDGGCGYFVFRTAPTLTVEGGTGTKADFEVTLKNEKCVWSVDTVTVTDGEGYTEGDEISFAVADGDTVITPATAVLHTEHETPTLTASAAGGTGANIAITAYAKNDNPPETWSVSEVFVFKGGSAYTDGSPVVFTLGTGDVTVTDAVATISTNRVQPTLAASVNGTGSGAILTVFKVPNFDSSAWTVSEIGVTDGGTGYSEWDPVSISVTDGQAAGVSWFDAYVTSVDQDGAITAISVYSSDEYYKDGGVIQSVTLSSGGAYFKETGIPESVEVTEPGKYYREDPDAEPCADVNIEACGGGVGAKITPTFGTDKNNPETYGRIVSLKIDDGGEDYLAWGWKKTCYEQLNGIPFVLKAATPLPLVSLCFDSCFGSGAAATVVPLGARSEPDICLVGSGTGGTITPTLASAGDENGNKWLPTWEISSVAASGGDGYTNDEQATIDYRGATVSESAEVTLQTTSGPLTGATVVKGGKFYVQHDYDGTPGPIKLVTLDSGGSGYARYGRQQPVLKAAPMTITGGVPDELWTSKGGTFFWTLSDSKKDSCGLNYWEIASVTAVTPSDFSDKPVVSLHFSHNDGGALRSDESQASITVTADAFIKDLTVTVAGGAGIVGGAL